MLGIEAKKTDEWKCTSRNRDVAVDYFKMLATLLVMNSHAEALYPKYQFLASGGAIGDALFMFCSGFTLFIGTMGRFDNYYKRRLSRIVPSMVAVSILMVIVAFFHGDSLAGKDIGITLTTKNYLYWKLLFYIPLFYVRKYFSNKLGGVLFVIAVMVAVAYYFFPFKHETGAKGMWGSLYHNWKWFWYFVIMFWGAYIGKIRDRLCLRPILDSILCLFCFIGFYMFPMLSKKNQEIAPYQVFMIPLLMGFCYYLYKVLSADLFIKLYQLKLANWLILVIGGLCLESYLIHMKLFTPELNTIFPLNLLIIYIAVLFVAYIVRCIARTFLQTFQKEDYNWNKVFSIK